MTAQNRQQSSLRQDIGRLWQQLSPRRRQQLGFLLVLMVASSLSEVVSLGAVFPFLGALSNAPAIFANPDAQPWLARFQIESPSQLILVLASVFIVAVIIASILRIATINAQTRLAAAIGSDMSCQLYWRTLLQPYQFHTLSNSSTLISSIVSDTRSLTTNVLIPTLTIVTDIVIAFGIILTLFVIDGRVAVIAGLLIGTAYTVIFQIRRQRLSRNSKIIAENNRDLVKIIQEGIGGIRDVILMGSHDFLQNAYEKTEFPLRQATASNVIIGQTPRYVIEAIAMIAIALLTLTLGQEGDFSQAIPVLGSLVLGANRLLPVIQQAFASLVKIQGSAASLHRVLGGLERVPDPTRLLTPPAPLALNHAIRFDQVWFRYGHGDVGAWVLKGLDFEIQAKTTVGFVGTTGSGKSTTADLILGLLKPQRGSILVDGEVLAGERLRAWQQGIAHVPQSIFLTDGTIAQNIAFGLAHEAIDLAQVQRAAQLAQIDEFILSLPQQYQTEVGERGVRLSGGQRQRIGIARALYRQASVIVFDEATSALDNATETEVMAAIHALSHQVTMILIAHRLSTVEKCDSIVELSQGKIVAQGSYQELLATSSSFQVMVQGGVS